MGCMKDCPDRVKISGKKHDAVWNLDCASLKFRFPSPVSYPLRLNFEVLTLLTLITIYVHSVGFRDAMSQQFSF